MRLNTAEIVVDDILQRPSPSEALAKHRSATGLMADISRTGEVQLTPLSLVIRLCKDLLDLTFHRPSLQPESCSRRLPLGQAPFYGAFPLPTDPLSIDIGVNVDIDAALDVYRKVCCRYRLAQSRCWRDG